MSLVASPISARSSARCWHPRRSSGRYNCSNPAAVRQCLRPFTELCGHDETSLQAAEAQAASLSRAQEEHGHLQKAVLGDLKCGTNVHRLRSVVHVLSGDRRARLQGRVTGSARLRTMSLPVPLQGPCDSVSGRAEHPGHGDLLPAAL